MMLMVGGSTSYKFVLFRVLPPDTIVKFKNAAKFIDEETAVYYFPYGDTVGIISTCVSVCIRVYIMLYCLI